MATQDEQIAALLDERGRLDSEDYLRIEEIDREVLRLRREIEGSTISILDESKDREAAHVAQIDKLLAERLEDAELIRELRWQLLTPETQWEQGMTVGRWLEDQFDVMTAYSLSFPQYYLRNSFTYFRRQNAPQPGSEQEED